MLAVAGGLLSGCGPVEEQGTEGANAEQMSQGLGSFVAKYRLRNNEGYCIIKGGRGYALTQKCQDSASSSPSAEVFDIWVADGRYNICTQGTTECLSDSHGKFFGFTNIDRNVGRFIELSGGKIGYNGKTGILYRTAESGGGGYLRLGDNTNAPDRIWKVIKVN